MTDKEIKSLLNLSSMIKCLPLSVVNSKHPVRKWKWKAENRASSNSTSQGSQCPGYHNFYHFTRLGD